MPNALAPDAAVWPGFEPSRPRAERLRRRVMDAWVAVLLFLFVYNLSPLTAPSVTSGRVVLIVLAIVLWRRALAELGGFVAANRVVVIASGLALIYAAALYVVTGAADFIQLSRCLHFCAFGLAGAFLFAVLVEFDERRFCEAFAVATAVQAVFIVVSYASAGYREWLSGVLIQGGNIPLTSATQAPGFSNSSGALLSVIQSLGVFAALQGARQADRFRRALGLTVVALLDGASTVFVARTGLMLSVCFIALFLLVGGKLVRRALLAGGTVAVALAVALGPFVALRLSRANEAFEDVAPWALELFTQGARGPSYRDLASQPVPALSLETVLGTGLVATNAYENASGNDSGYVQTYFALGLVMAVVFYGGVALGLLGSLSRSRDRLLLGFLAVGLFTVEVKEPFFFKYVYPFLVVALLYLSARHAGRATPAPPSGQVA